MKNLLLLSAFALLAACSAPNTPEAIGEHNLSKGSCVHIPDNGRMVKDKMVQDVCLMTGGEFEPRNHLKRRWF